MRGKVRNIVTETRNKTKMLSLLFDRMEILMTATSKDKEIGKKEGTQTISVYRWYYSKYGKWNTVPKSIRNYSRQKLEGTKINNFLYNNKFAEKIMKKYVYNCYKIKII